MPEIVLLAFIAALISLDITPFGQFMFSRPIVVAPLFGCILGDLTSGIWIGIIVEFVWIGILPMGAAVPADITTVAILATIWGIKTMPNNNAVMVLALIFALPSAMFFKLLDMWIRKINVLVMRWVENGVKAGKIGRVSKGIFIGIVLFFLKAFVFYFAFIIAGEWLVGEVFAMVPSKVMYGLFLSWRFLPIMALGIMFRNFSPKLTSLIDGGKNARK
ncbi:MAG: PTS sugar transporter subunit IIC [Endomicrobiales bacterium]|nr:PTS sugar transporter subunit IIC [Endomicrobiales bacterium]